MQSAVAGSFLQVATVFVPSSTFSLPARPSYAGSANAAETHDRRPLGFPGRLTT